MAMAKKISRANHVQDTCPWCPMTMTMKSTVIMTMALLMISRKKGTLKMTMVMIRRVIGTLKMTIVWDTCPPCPLLNCSDGHDNDTDSDNASQ